MLYELIPEAIQFQNTSIHSEGACELRTDRTFETLLRISVQSCQPSLEGGEILFSSGGGQELSRFLCSCC